MSYESGFYPLSSLWQNEKLRMLLLSALAGVSVGMAGAAVYSHFTKVHADKIADVAIVSKSVGEKLDAYAVPVSEIATVAQTDKPTLIKGFAATAVDVCGSSMKLPNEPVVLLTREGSRYVAVKTKLDQSTCQIFLKQTNPQQVWVVSDSKLNDKEWHPAFMAVNSQSGTTSDWLAAASRSGVSNGEIFPQ